MTLKVKLRGNLFQILYISREIFSEPLGTSNLVCGTREHFSWLWFNVYLGNICIREMVDVGKGLSWHFEIWWCKPFKLHLEINTKWNLNLRFNKLLLTKFRLPSSSEHYKQLTKILTNSTQYKGTYGWKWKYKERKIITKELQLNIELVCLQNILICGCHTQSQLILVTS